MPAKKKTKHINTITEGEIANNIVDYATLKTGECFKYQNEIYMKERHKGDTGEDYDQYAVCLKDGIVTSDWCGITVLPVTIEVVWA